MAWLRQQVPPKIKLLCFVLFSEAVLMFTHTAAKAKTATLVTLPLARMSGKGEFAQKLRGKR